MEKKILQQCVEILERRPTMKCDKCVMQCAVSQMLKTRSEQNWSVIDATDPSVQALLTLLGIDVADNHCHQAHELTAIHTAQQCLFITNKVKIVMAIIKGIFHFCKRQNYSSVLLVTKHKVTSFAHQSACELSISCGVSIKSMLWTEVLFNALLHQLSPTYKVVTKAYVLQKKPLIKSLRLSELPKIRSADPVVRYLGCANGQILSITRGDGEETFRVVVG